MGQIEELQGRIATALDRISQGLDLQANTPGDSGDTAELMQALEEERVTTQQLEERNRALNDKIATLEAQLDALQAQMPTEEDIGFPDVMQKFGATIAKLRESNQTARDNNKKLRQSMMVGISEPHLINSGMMQELNSLRSARELDRAELQAILESLEAALGGSQTAEGGM